MRCILSSAYSHTWKTVADQPGFNWATRACWAASSGVPASISIFQVTRNSNRSPREDLSEVYLNGEQYAMTPKWTYA